MDHALLGGGTVQHDLRQTAQEGFDPGWAPGVQDDVKFRHWAHQTVVAGLPAPLWRGSSTSRIASPRTLKASISRTRAAVGPITSHGAMVMKSRALDSMLPQSAWGGLTPRPRKLSEA